MDADRPMASHGVFRWIRRRADRPISLLAVEVYTGHAPGTAHAELGVHPPTTRRGAPRPAAPQPVEPVFAPAAPDLPLRDLVLRLAA